MSAPFSGSFGSVRYPSGGGGVSGAPGWIENVAVYDAGTMARSAWSPGAYQVLVVAAQPSLQEQWVIQGWTIACELHWQPESQTVPSFGRLGRLIGALIPNAAGLSSAVPSPGLPWFQSLPSLPSSGYQDVMWDGAVDSPPSTWSSNPVGSPPTAPSMIFPATPRIHTYSFPNPLALPPGENVAMGLYLTPSLQQNTDLFVTNATYTIWFDTQPSPGISGAGWGQRN